MSEETIYDKTSSEGVEDKDATELDQNENTSEETSPKDETKSSNMHTRAKIAGIAGAAAVAGLFTPKRTFAENLDDSDNQDNPNNSEEANTEGSEPPTPSHVHKGHDLPVAASVNDDMTFGQAFAAARAEVGAGGIFTWHRHSYGTYYAEEWHGMSQEQKEEYWNNVYHTTNTINHNAFQSDTNTTPITETEQATETDQTQEPKEKKPKGNLWMALGGAAAFIKRFETKWRYMAAIGRGSAQYDSGNYAEARAIFVEASSTPHVNTAEADSWIDKCDARIRERAEAERIAKAEAERKAKEEAVRKAKAKGILPGVFSVSATTKVQFSKGNLTYNRRTQEWAFYEHQYDCASGYDGNLISLFTWGYGDCSSYPGTESGGSTFIDWGTRMGDGRTWRMLSEDEWEYLIDKRTTSSGIRYAKAKINGVSGLVVVPDDWNTSTYALSKTNSVDANFTANVISRNTWNDKLEPGTCSCRAPAPAMELRSTTLGRTATTGLLRSAVPPTLIT